MIDPILPTTPLVIDGKVYEMCLDLGALAEAETQFNHAGFDVNLVYALPSLNLASTRILFAASLQYKHSEMPFEDRINLLKLPNVLAAANAIAEAWKASMPTESARPPEPVQPGASKAGSNSGHTAASHSASRKKSSSAKRRAR